MIRSEATLEFEKADAQGRTRVKLSEVRPAGDASGAFLAELREAGRAWLGRAFSPCRARLMGASKPSHPTLFTIIYTSGTTGTPKGAELSHRNLTSAVASACRAMILFPEDEQLLFLPLAHVLGRELGWVAVQAGLVTWFAESIAKLKENLLEVRPTYMAGVPRVFEKFIRASNWH